MPSGGKRPGSGRKKGDTITINYRIHKADKDFIDALASETGFNQGEIIHQLVEHFKATSTK